MDMCSTLCLCCSECCKYVQNMCKLLPYLIYEQHVCYLCMRHVLLAHMHATGMLTSVSCMYTCYNVLHICRLHTCKLLVFFICAAYIHAYYYCAAYMPLAHMQATSVAHMQLVYMHIAAHINHVYSIRSYGI